MLTFLIFCFMLFLLIYPSLTKEFASLGLITWLENMIPSLLPFMILSGILIQLDLSALFSKPFGILLKPVFKVNNYCIYVIVMGFICGFPMGAKACVDLFQREKITKNEARYLLSFTNNIGPAYFLTFVLGQIYQTHNIFFSCFIMFGIPFLYGIFLRYTVYRNKISFTETTVTLAKPDMSFFDAVDTAITNGLVQIGILGGYMLFFNLLILIPYLLLGNHYCYSFLHSLTEISGGLTLTGKENMPYIHKFIFVHTALAFNGLCCLFQTLHLLKGTGLSGQKYMLHKIILCSITCLVIIIANQFLKL